MARPEFLSRYVCQTARIVADDREGGTEMRLQRHTCARGLVVGAISVAAFVAGTGVANADPDPFSPSAPGIVDLIVADTPALSVDPADEGGRSTDWGGVGMYCENMFVRCR